MATKALNRNRSARAAATTMGDPVTDRQVEMLRDIVARQHGAAPQPAIGPAEREACDYIAELCEGLLLLEGVARLPLLNHLLMLLHALTNEYLAQAHRAGQTA